MSKLIRKQHGWALTLALRLLCSMPARAIAQPAAEILVTTTNGSSPAGDCLCSYFEAIQNSNADADVTDGDCQAGTGPNDVIFVPANASPYGTGGPIITDAVIIVGGGIDRTVLQSTRNGAVALLQGQTTGVTMIGLTIDGFQAEFANGITNNNSTIGAVTLSSVRLTRLDQAIGLSGVGSPLFIENSTIDNNLANPSILGYAILARGGMTMVNSTVSGNQNGME